MRAALKINTLCILLLATGCGYSVPVELAERTAAQVKSARALAEAADAEWKQAMDGIASLDVDHGWVACDYEVVPIHQLSGDSITVNMLLGDVKGKRHPVDLIEAAKLTETHSPRWQMADRALDMIEYYLRPDERFEADRKEHIEAELAKAAEYAQPGFYSWDLIILIDAEAEAQVIVDRHGLPASQVEKDIYTQTTTTPYTPGRISGRAFLYNYNKDAFSCAGRFSAGNSTQITRYTQGSGLRWTLRDDLRGQAIIRAIQGLRKMRVR